MHRKPLHRRSCFSALLISIAMGGSAAGCGQDDSLWEAETASTHQADTRVDSHWLTETFGSAAGGKQGKSPIGNTTPVTFINGYASGDLIYGIELKWGTTASKMYGVTNSLDPQPLDAEDDPICQVRYCVNSSGLLSGVRFRTVNGFTLTLGSMCGSASSVAFNDIDDVLTNMVTYRGVALTGMQLVYTGPES